MAGTGPAPKPAATRARRNKTSTNAVLRAPEPGSVEAPKLPRSANGWHAMTRAWWRDIWSSPMAPEFDSSDIHGLYTLAVVVNDFWTAETAKDRQAASTEIRLQSQRYGLSPMDRRRLQWEIEKTEEAKDRGAKRRRRSAEEGELKPPAHTGGQGVDPRALLRSV